MSSIGELSDADKKFISESVAFIERNKPHKESDTNRDVDAYENDSGTCKSVVITESDWYKSEHVSELYKSTSNDSLREIAKLLGKIFKFWPSNDGWWLHVAQTYILRSIKWVLSDTVKQYLRGAIRKTPVHYFTNEIRYRTKRKIPKRKRESIGTIDSHKQKGVNDND